MSSKTKALHAIGVVTLILLAGCSGPGALGADREQHVKDRIEERLGQVDRYEITTTTELNYSNRTGTMRTHVQVDLEAEKYRIEVLAPESRAGAVVYNGSVQTVYDASENTVRRTDRATFESQVTPGSIVQLVDHREIVYNGTEMLNGTQTHKVTLVATNESSRMGTATLWVTTTDILPVKLQTPNRTVRYSNVELNPDFPDGTFEFEAPDTATVADDS